MSEQKKFLDYEGIKHLWSKINMQDYPNNETLMAVINAIDETKADKNEIVDNIKQYFLVVETIQDGTNYLLDGITFDELYNKFQRGNVNMVCHVDGTDYIPLLSVTRSKIIFSGIYQTTSVSLDFDSQGVGTLTSTNVCTNNNLTSHTSDKDIHITVTEKEKWNSIEEKIPTTPEAIGADPEGAALESLIEAKAYTNTAIADLVNSAPETLDTLGELATAFQENADIVATLNAAVTNKAEKSDLENLSDLVDINATNIASLQNDLFNLIYPVGAVYLSATEVSPSVLFGGVWEQIKDTFLLSAGDTYTAGSTGGEATHTLNIEEMPSHVHDISSSLMWANQTGDVQGGTKTYYARSGAQTTQLTGGNQPHNNMPPYLTVYMWKRIA